MMSEMTIAVIVVSASCHHNMQGLIPADHEYLDSVARGLAMIARWHQRGTMTSQMLARANFPPSV